MKLHIVDSIRTNNFTDPDMANKIQQLWQENLPIVREQHAYGKSIYAVYHSYKSNYKGDYTLSICTESLSDNTDFSTDDNNYITYHVDEQDKMGVINAWKTIWADEERQQLTRKYSVDFEKYDPNGMITIYIAI